MRPPEFRFQFLTGSRFHFYYYSWAAMLRALQRFNSLQEVGFISTIARHTQVFGRRRGFNSLQEVGFISTVGRPCEIDDWDPDVSIPYRK